MDTGAMGTLMPKPVAIHWGLDKQIKDFNEKD